MKSSPSKKKNIILWIIFQVNVTMKKAGSKMEHQGIKIEFIGQIGKLNHFSFFPLFGKGGALYDSTTWLLSKSNSTLIPWYNKNIFQNYTMTEEITMSLPPLSRNLLGQGRLLETQPMGLSFNRLKSHTSHTQVPMWGYGTWLTWRFGAMGSDWLKIRDVRSVCICLQNLKQVLF